MDARALAILVLEDNRTMRERLCGDLRGRGCQVTAVANDVEGLEAIVLGRFDVVVSDALMLPRGGRWLWQEATALRPELRGRFIFCTSDPLPTSSDGPGRTERFVSLPLDLDALWEEILSLSPITAS